MNTNRCNNILKIEGLKLMMFSGIKYSFFNGNIIHSFKKLEKINNYSWLRYNLRCSADKTEVFKRNNTNAEKVNFTSVKEKIEAFKLGDI